MAALRPKREAHADPRGGPSHFKPRRWTPNGTKPLPETMDPRFAGRTLLVRTPRGPDAPSKAVAGLRL